jgi:hypothetical protein
MNKIVLTAPCGLDCFNCPSYEGNITEEYKTRLSEFLKIPRDKTPCKGCRDEKGHCKFIKVRIVLPGTVYRKKEQLIVMSVVISPVNCLCLLNKARLFRTI